MGEDKAWAHSESKTEDADARHARVLSGAG
jgi:hypothetical protein